MSSKDFPRECNQKTSNVYFTLLFCFLIFALNTTLPLPICSPKVKSFIALMKPLLVAFLACLLSEATSCLATEPQDFRNPDLLMEQRVQSLIGQLTVQEKVAQLMMASPAIDRLGIPAYHWWSEALHGVARNGTATVFPQAIGLAATWDPDLLQQMAGVISTEARAKYAQTIARTGGASGMYQGLTLWSPNINIFRDPRWGRGQETYGEDPFLTATLGVAFVRGIQGNDSAHPLCVATVKHFAVHSGPEAGRHSFNSLVSSRDLRETYLPAFEKCIRQGGALSVMTAYNAINGIPAPANQKLLTDVLRGEWGFSGAVVSDVEAVDNLWRQNAHAFAKDQAEASAQALKAGNDLCSSETFKALPEALKRGLIKESDLDVALRRVLGLRLKLGLFDPPDRAHHRGISSDAVDRPEHDQLALELARKSLVLLKNDGTLPWDSTRLKKVAVLGPTADDPSALLGNYCGRPARPVTILKGLRNALEPRGVQVRFQPAVALVAGFRESSQPLPEGVLFTDHTRAKPGLKGELFPAEDFLAAPLADRIDSNLDLLWNDYEPQPEIPTRNAHLRWSGVLVAPESGLYTLSVTFTGKAGLYLEDQLIAGGESPAKNGEKCSSSKPLQLRAGQAYPLRIEFHQPPEDVWGRIQFGWQAPGGIGSALQLARESDHVLLVLGITPNLEGEDKPINAEGFRNGDRTTILLPKCQRDLLDQVAMLGKPFTVVLTNGSPVSFDTSKPNAILEAWYYGQRGGDAVAEALLGKTNPSGRLPITFPKADTDLPAFEDYSMAHRTYRYFQGTPLFAFGHGLSYTTFRYESPAISPAAAKRGQTVQVSVDLTNTGKSSGDEVVQVYARMIHPKVPMPRQALVGFQRVTLTPGETRRISVPIPLENLRRWSEEENRYAIDPGSYQLGIGGASNAIQHSVPLTIE